MKGFLIFSSSIQPRMHPQTKKLSMEILSSSPGCLRSSVIASSLFGIDGSFTFFVSKTTSSREELSSLSSDSLSSSSALFKPSSLLLQISSALDSALAVRPCLQSLAEYSSLLYHDKTLLHPYQCLEKLSCSS